MQRSVIDRASATFWTSFRPPPRHHHLASASPPPCTSLILFGHRQPRSTNPAKTTRTCRNSPCSSKPARVRTAKNSPKRRCRSPRPIRSKKSIDDPGTGEQTVDAPTRWRDATPMLDADSRRRADSTHRPPSSSPAASAGTVLTTTGESRDAGAAGRRAGARGGGRGHAAARAGHAHAQRAAARAETARHQHDEHRAQLAAGRPAVLGARDAPARRRQHRPRAGDRRNHDRARTASA